MAKFYRKPKPETMKKNRETYREAYKDEIEWLKDNVSKINKYNPFRTFHLFNYFLYFC